MFRRLWLIPHKHYTKGGQAIGIAIFSLKPFLNAFLASL